MTVAVSPAISHAARVRSASPWRDIWLRWLVANIAGELVGFGLAAAAGALVASAMQRTEGGAAIVLGVSGVLLLGTLEGTVLGFAQWRALRHWLPGLGARAWLLATVGGAIVAWGAGMAGGTWMGSGAVFAEAPEDPATIALGAAGVGIVAGCLLSSTQWLVLRRVLAHAGYWVPAHALAWAVGMIVSFVGMGLIQGSMPLALIALIGAATGLAMGASVAALTGLALVWLLSSNRAFTERDPRGNHRQPR